MTTPTFLHVTDPFVSVMGRTQRLSSGELRMGYPGVSLALRYEGPAPKLCARGSSPNSHVAIFLDGQRRSSVRLPEGRGVTDFKLDPSPVPCELRLVHQTETWLGTVTLEGFDLHEDTRVLAPAPLPQRRLLFIGDSVTCGEAAARLNGPSQDKPSTWDAAGSYGMLLGQLLDAQVHLVSYGGRGLLRDWQGRRDVLNAPEFFELSIPLEEPSSDATLAWDHQSYVPDAIVLSLGTNDFNLELGAFPEQEEWVARYQTFLQRLRQLYPEARLFLTEGAIVKDDHGTLQKRALTDYLLATIKRLGDSKLHHLPARHYPGTPDDGHPTSAEHRSMAGDIAPILRQALGW